MKVVAISIVPSPYQRDLFAALARRPEIDLQVYYCEAASPDSPWPKRPLESYEKVLPGFYVSWGQSRFLVNARIPGLAGADALILNGYITLPAQILSRLARRRIPVIFWGEKMVAGFDGVKGTVQRLLARPLDHVSAIVAIGKDAEEDYRQRYPEIPVYELPYLCRLEAFSESPPDRPRKPLTILFCGQMIKRKGVDLLLQAFERLVEAGLEAELLLVGREAELPEMLANLADSTRAHVTYAGFKAPEDLPEVYRQADVFVLPSRYDGWGVVVNQAVGAGLPVICSTSVGSARDLVHEGENGHLYDAEDVNRLAEILMSYARSPDKVARQAKASLAMAEEISPDAGARRWTQIIEQVISSHENTVCNS